MSQICPLLLASGASTAQRATVGTAASQHMYSATKWATLVAKAPLLKAPASPHQNECSSQTKMPPQIADAAVKIQKIIEHVRSSVSSVQHAAFPSISPCHIKSLCWKRIKVASLRLQGNLAGQSASYTSPHISVIVIILTARLMILVIVRVATVAITLRLWLLPNTP